MKNTFHRLLPSLFCWVLGLMFILAAFSKINDIEAFHKTLAGIRFLPLWIKGAAFLILPGLELVLGFCLLLRFNLKETSWIVCALLALFLAFGIYSTLMGKTSGCGCFKIKGTSWLQLTGWWIVLRNLCFLSLGFLILRAELKKTERVKV